MKTGLVIGKFAPLHKGHQHLIETVIQKMDRVVVFIYDCSDITSVPLSVRAGWVHVLYPEVYVVEGYNPPPRGVWNETIMHKHADFVERAVSPYTITHVFSGGEEYGEYLSCMIGATHVIVDKERSTVPVSGTEIRENPEAYKDFLHAVVYKDLVV